MIGMGLKKLAGSHDMKVAGGVAYGSLHGYAATLSEGAGYKMLAISTTFADAQQQFELRAQLDGKALQRQYRVQELTFAPDHIRVVFHDNPGTMKKVEAFIEWFFPLIARYSAQPANVCTHCGKEISIGCWKLIDGVAYNLHDECAREVQEQIESEKEQVKSGSYLMGAVGALLGTLLGAALWALVWVMGYVASLVGFVIGWLAEKGYELLRGKQGRGKLVILLVCVVLGVLLGTAAGEAASLTVAIADGEIPEMTYADIVWVLIALLAEGEYVRSILGNIAIGLLFAALGVFGLMRRTKREVSGVRIADLP